MATTEVIFFAIQSALRLGQAARQAYVDSTRNRGLALPLPDFNPRSNRDLAERYFLNRRPDYRPPGLEALLARIAGNPGIGDVDQKKLINFHVEALLTDSAVGGSIKLSADGTFFTTEGLSSLVAIRQWERGSEFEVTPLQRVAGTIFEIAVDYFAHVPGALNKNSAHGKALHTLLQAIDSVEFSTVPLGDLPVKFFTAAMETISENPGLITSDGNSQELIRITSKALTEDVKARIAKIRGSDAAGDDVAEQRVIDWAELVFRSVLRSGAKTALEDPKRYLGIDNEGSAALVDHVGVAALDFILSQPTGSMDRAFGRAGLEIVVKASLTAVGEHPEIVTSTGNQGLRKLLSEMATDLAKFDSLVAPGTLPEVARLVLEKTGKNLPLIWPDANNPKRHLLLTAASETLEILTRKTDGKWNPKFGKEELLGVVETVSDEFLKNPGWLVDGAGEQSGTLKVALEAVVDVLRKRGDQRLTRETGIIVLQTALKSVSKHKRFLEKLPGDNGQLFVAAIIDTALGNIFGEDIGAEAQWSLLHQNVITEVIGKALEAAEKTGAGPAHVAALDSVLKAQAADLAAGKPFDLDQLIDTITKEIASAAGANPANPGGE